MESTKERHSLDPSTVTCLKAIDKNESIYLGEDGEARLEFRTNLSIVDEKYHQFNLTGAPLVALGLTEVCRRIGKGKIYWMSKPEPTGYTQYKKGTAGVYIFQQLPDLVYDPVIWGPNENKAWDSMSHSARHRTLDARAGALKSTQCVMPIALTYDAIEKETVRINAYHKDDYACKAILCIVPKAYLRWCTQLSDRAKYECGRDRDQQRWWKTEPSVLERYKALTAEAVVRRLWAMYYEGEPRALSEFQDISAAVREHHRQWAPVAAATRPW